MTRFPVTRATAEFSAACGASAPEDYFAIEVADADIGRGGLQTADARGRAWRGTSRTGAVRTCSAAGNSCFPRTWWVSFVGSRE